MHIRKLSWRVLLPALIFPISLIEWLRYHTSVRVLDDAPPPWSWYGDPFLPWIDLPAAVYAKAARLFTPTSFGIRYQRAWIDPETTFYFVMVIVFWYWIGKRVELRGSSGSPLTSTKRIVFSILYALGASLWMIIAVGSAYELATMWHVWNWYHIPQIVDSPEFFTSAGVLWGAILGTYFVQAILKLNVRLK